MSNDTYYKKKTIENLKAYIDGKFKSEETKVSYGLCYNVIVGIDVVDIFRTWPNYSGNDSYPIEGSCGEYFVCGATRHDVTTIYGKLRMELAKYTLAELEKTL